MFQSGLTKNLYRNFIKDLIYNKSKEPPPYVYVEQNPQRIRFLAEISRPTAENQIEALSFSKFGDIEILSTE